MIHLGGYCSIACTPGTVCTLRGEPYKEALFLAEGTLTCSVDPGAGEFSVLTDMGSVSVLGTEFSVTVKKKGEDQESGARSVCMEVSVTSGSVAVETGAGERVIEAGGVAAFAGPDAERGPESIETIQQTECSGPMLMYGGDLYAVSGSVLCRIDAVSGEMTAKKDLSSLGSEQASLRAERGGAARLFVNREKLFMLKNGMLFVFDVKTLTLERTVEIADPVTTNRGIQRSGSFGEQDLF